MYDDCCRVNVAIIMKMFNNLKGNHENDLFKEKPKINQIPRDSLNMPGLSGSGDFFICSSLSSYVSTSEHPQQPLVTDVPGMLCGCLVYGRLCLGGLCGYVAVCLYTW